MDDGSGGDWRERRMWVAAGWVREEENGKKETNRGHVVIRAVRARGGQGQAQGSRSKQGRQEALDGGQESRCSGYRRVKQCEDQLSIVRQFARGRCEHKPSGGTRIPTISLPFERVWMRA
jgi:hypothetical protein